MPIYISKTEVAITSITSVDDLFYVQYSFDVDIDSSVTGIVKNLDEIGKSLCLDGGSGGSGVEFDVVG
ncbi:unnamed protein product [Rotaria sordida]|uniref:Uncharacterized protein n=1 Tax=Rotaria sordida TaxID=392033 RepID=A0A814WGG8_9BILA|nr:unnamed protein product [Rotaria sordida]